MLFIYNSVICFKLHFWLFKSPFLNMASTILLFLFLSSSYLFYSAQIK